MTNIFDQMKLIPAKPAIETLKLLWHRRNEHGRPPYVTLGTGRTSFTGWICSADFRANDCPVVLVMPGANGHPSDELAYMSGRLIDWIVVHHANDHLETLSEGRIDSLSSRTPPGKLLISRKQKDLGSSLQALTGAELTVNLDWQSINEGETRHMVLTEVTLDALAQAFKELIVDDLSKEAVRSKVKSLEIKIGQDRKIDLGSGTLHIVLNPEKGADGRYTVSELKSQLNDVL